MVRFYVVRLGSTGFGSTGFRARCDVRTERLELTFRTVELLNREPCGTL